ncbi:MAG: hypothetical protein A2854_00060 [Parcubacteria group bacterium RIFCSPHIGHO2_01_FULL_56_18]|nr:MAG: hypothetical protein A2854_00060 [Parcubacteria group bacterium RIFCSPHIGHO2_01_FULL_56_18]
MSHDLALKHLKAAREVRTNAKEVLGDFTDALKKAGLYFKRIEAIEALVYDTINAEWLQVIENAVENYGHENTFTALKKLETR